MAHERIQPEGLFQSGPLGFTQVVASAPGRTIHDLRSGRLRREGPAGLRGARPAGRGRGRESLKRALSAAGATPADLTMLRVYIVDYTPEVAGPVGQGDRRALRRR